MNVRVKTINASKKQLFRFWVGFLKPYHRLRPKEMEALSIMLYYRHELSMDVSNKDLVDQLLFSSEIRSAIREDLGGMSNVVFNNLLSVLRRKDVLSKNNIINESLIPPMSPTDISFTLAFNFELNGNK